MAGSLAGRRTWLTDRRPWLADLDPALVAAIAVGLGAVAVGRATMLPTVGSWDTAEAQTVLPLMGTMHPTGFPAYVLLGWLASVVLQPLGSPAFTMNLLSTILAGVATGSTVLVARRLGSPLPLAVATGAGFALTPVVWYIGSAADAHALHVVLVVLVVLGLVRWERLVARRRERPDEPGLARRADRALVVTAAVFGVAAANHGLTLLLVPAIGMYVLVVEPGLLVRPRLVAAALGACLAVAALLYLELPLRAGPFRAALVYGHPETWGGFWDILLARQFQTSVGGPWADPPAMARGLVALATDQFGPLAALIPVGLVVTVIRLPRYALLSFVAAVVTCLFAATYVNARIDRYYLGPVFFAWTWISILAAAVVDVASVISRGAPRRALPTPAGPALRHLPTLLAVALGVALLLPTAAALPERWRSADRSRETWVETWLDDALSAMEPHAVVISWWSYSTPLWYAQLVEGRRPDIEIDDDRTRLDRGLGNVEDVINANLGTRPVYVMRAQGSEIEDLRRRYVIEPAGRAPNLYRVTGTQEISP